MELLVCLQPLLLVLYVNPSKYYENIIRETNYSLFQICDRTNYPIVVSILGNLLLLMYYLLIGPVPFVPIELTEVSVYVLAAMVGIGFGCVQVSTFSRSYQTVNKLGFANNIDTNLIMSGKCKKM